MRRRHPCRRFFATAGMDHPPQALIPVDHSYTGIKEISQEAKVYIFDNQLYVDTPLQEMIYLYSVYGQLEYMGVKPKGMQVIPLGGANRRILIVKGGSGWVRKVMK